jgi:ABC-type transport system substrate-binding protein
VGLIADDSWLHSRSRNSEFGLAGYANPRADSMMDALAAMVDRESSRPLWREYQRMMIHQAPATILYYAKTVAAASPRLQGVEMAISAPYTFARRWWILPTRRQ